MADLTAEHRLVVYGTLAPGCSNEHVLTSIPGRWSGAIVRGTRIDVVSAGAAAGYPGLTLDDGDDVACMLFESSELPNTGHGSMSSKGRGTAGSSRASSSTGSGARRTSTSSLAAETPDAENGRNA